MTNRTCLRLLWQATVGTRKKTLLMSLLGCLASLISLSFVWCCKLLVDIATGHSDFPLISGILLLILSLCLQRVFWTNQSRLMTLNQVQLQNNMRHRLFNHLMRSIWVGKEKYHTGDMLNRMERDVQVVSDAISNTVTEVLMALVQFGAAFFYLCHMDYRLSLIVLIIMPIAILLSKIYMRKMRTLTAEIRKTDSAVQEHMQEGLQHRILIRTLERTPASVDELGGLQETLYTQVKNRTRFSLFSRTIIQVGFNVGYVVVFVWCILGLRQGNITYGMMTAFLQLVALIQRPLISLSHQLPAFVHALTSIERLHELLEMPLETTASPIHTQGPTGIRIQDLTFRYPDGERDILSHFCHNFQPHTVTAVMGETGVGKSTLIRIILALLRPNQGTIQLYDQQHTYPISPDTRCNIVYVPQGNTLLSGTIRDNLLLAKADATPEEMQQALHTAAADFVYTLPNKLDTLCGESGTGLSEGQAQRIAIARGLLRQGSVLILDEPTSALDLATEQLLIERLHQIVTQKTVIVVTHRQSILSLCNQVVQL